MNNTWNRWTSRPPPPAGAPPAYALATRRNLRPIVMFCASLSALWALTSAIGNFRSISVANDGGFKSLVTFAIVMGALHLGVFVCEMFGVVAAWTQRLPLIRAYAFLSGFTTLIVVAVGLVRVVVHFTLKNDIIKECTDFATNKDVYYYPFGFWGPVSHETIDTEEAQDWCNDSWNHDSWADIVALLITLVLAGLFTVVAFSYYRQALDPASARVPAANSHPAQHYNPAYQAPYNASVPTMGYDYNQGYMGAGGYAPPQGPPPGFTHPQFAEDKGDVDAKPPGYEGSAVAYGADKKDGEDPFADFESRGDAHVQAQGTGNTNPFR
ncbi:hypothetical protein CPB85DRAFT_1317409 [Mucidula mucida]|nr:hypothetical protein CPB85DRAFT_1317409 [Mucidula mucida]